MQLTYDNIYSNSKLLFALVVCSIIKRHHFQIMVSLNRSLWKSSPWRRLGTRIERKEQRMEDELHLLDFGFLHLRTSIVSQFYWWTFQFMWFYQIPVARRTW